MGAGAAHAEGDAMNGTLPGLGRLAAPDDRDRAYPMRAVLPAMALPKSRTWRAPAPLDQGPTSCCVGFAWRHWLSAAPIMDKPDAGPSAFAIYDAATQVDEWAENDRDTERRFGTSVRAAAKVIQSLGHLTTYVWAERAEDARDFILGQSPVVLGTDWMQAFFTPARDGTVRYRPDDTVAGGHAYLAIGYSAARGAFRCLNSWSRSWGDQGRFWLPGEALTALLERGGEACAGVEVRVR
jgi:hypothetical protein